MQNPLANLLQPDAFLAQGHRESFSSKNFLSPEKLLMLAVLENAVACIRGNARAPNSLVFREAAEWILDERADWLFSFENICAVLELDADYLREGLLDWNGRQLLAIRRPVPRNARRGRGLNPAQPSAILWHTSRNLTPEGIGNSPDPACFLGK